MKSRIIITIAVLIFLIIGTTIAIRWAEGYRFNLSHQKIEGTGLLVSNSQPQGASVTIDNELKTATDDTLHLTPGDYKVKLEKDGYYPWQKTLKIEKELVTQTNARLFPSVPDLSALTFNGASEPSPSPDGHKIAFKIATTSAQIKQGIWVTNLNDNPLRFGSNSILIVQDTESIKFSKAKIFWSPNSNEVLAYFNDNQAYLLNASSENKTTSLINAAFQVSSLLIDWQQQLALEDEKHLVKLPLEMQKIATQSATLLYFSPNEEKLLYTATASANLPDHMIPPLPAINSQVQNRNLEPGSIYVYDIKEDTNFLIKAKAFDAKTLTKLINQFYLPPASKEKTSPSADLKSIVDPNAIKPVSKPLIDQLEAIHAQYSPVYSLKFIQWFPDSSHLILVEKNAISILEYDGNNKVVVFPGLFAEDFAYPWPNGQKLVLLTSLASGTQIPANLYALDLQ